MANGNERYPIARFAKDVLDALAHDRDRLEFLEAEIQRRPTGLAFERSDDGGVRIVSESRIGDVFPNLRSAIDAWMIGKPNN